MHDTEAGRGYTAHDQGSIEPENCPHTVTERSGRVRDGTAEIDLDCVDCGEIVERDILERTVERGRGVATDGGQLMPKHRGTWTADSRGEVKLGSSVARQLGADRGDEVLVTWDDEVRVHGDAEAYEGPQSLSTTVTVGHEDRIALPAWARRELDLEPGDEVRGVADGDDVVVEEVDRDD